MFSSCIMELVNMIIYLSAYTKRTLSLLKQIAQRGQQAEMLPNCNNPCEKKGQLVRLMIKKGLQSLGQMLCRPKLMVLILLLLVKNASQNISFKDKITKKGWESFVNRINTILKFFLSGKQTSKQKQKMTPSKNNCPQEDNQQSIFNSFYCKITCHVTSKFVHLSPYERI